MATAWTRRRITRRLSNLLEADESVAAMQHLAVGGWWVVSDRALYVVPQQGPPRRSPFDDIRSVTVSERGRAIQVTVRSTAFSAIGDFRRMGAVVARLRELPPSSR